MNDDEQPKVDVRLTFEIRRGTVDARTDLPEFCVESHRQIVDLRHLAAEVLKDYPAAQAISRDDLARLAVKCDRGVRLKAKEYPTGIDRRLLDTLIVRIHRWLFWETYERNMVATSRFPARKFACGEDHCPKALALHGKIMPNENVERLPVRGCWGHRCDCRYQLVDRHGKVI